MILRTDDGWSPLALSLWISGWAGLAALVLGTSIGWLLVRKQVRAKWLIEGITLIALVLPPTVLGYYLLLLLGSRGLGPWLEQTTGLRLVFTWQGAIVAATVVALPLVVMTTRVSFGEISHEIEEAARVDGCTAWRLFWAITLPIAWRGILAGGLLGYLRALGEFGTTLMVAGNIPGRTQTLPIAIYDSLQAGYFARANWQSLLLTLLAFAFLAVVLWLRHAFDSS